MAGKMEVAKALQKAAVSADRWVASMGLGRDDLMAVPLANLKVVLEC